MTMLLHGGDFDLTTLLLVGLVWVVLPGGVLIWLAFWFGKRKSRRK